MLVGSIFLVVALCTTTRNMIKNKNAGLGVLRFHSLGVFVVVFIRIGIV